jgi:hypothetical protein
MDTTTAAILGVWIFATATALTKHVGGPFMLMSFIVALIITGVYA